MVGGEIVESLGRALWKNADIPPNAMRPLIETSDKTASQIIDAVKTEIAVGDQMKKAYETNNYEALNAGAGMLDDVSKSTRNKKNVEDLTKPKSEAALAREQKKLEAAQAEEGTIAREPKAFISNPQEARGQKPGMEDAYQSRQFQISEGDHGAGLDDNFPILREHPSFDNVEVGKPSILVQGLNLLGTEIGDSPKNINDILNNLTYQSRRARVSALDTQLGGAVHRDNLNDSLALSNFNPAELTDEQAVALNLFKKQNPGKTRADFDVKWKEQTGKTLPQGSFGPDIKVYKPDDTTRNARTELGRISIKSEADKANIMSRIFDVLEDNGYPVEEARKAYDQKKIKVDRNLDIYGLDHDHKHALINQAKKKPKTAIGRAEAVVKTGEIKNLSNGEALKVLFKSIQEQETILANQQLYRYEKIIELWHEDFALKHLHWDRQPPHVKQNFFMLNVNKIAVKGGNEKLLNLNQALKPIDEWPEGAEEVFGWKPQTLDVSDARLEQVAQQIDGIPNLQDMYSKGLEQP